MAASLAHEIRNPLVTIGGFARRLAGKLAPEDPNEKYASIISGEVARLENFLEEILLFGKDRSPVLRPVNLATIIGESLDLFASGFADAGIETVQNVDGDLPAIGADSSQLKQVFINLFSNALDVMPQGGRLTVSAMPGPADPSMVDVTVEDTGGGADPEVLRGIFNPFFTTKNGGHGLGLSLSQRIITAHGGTINVRNIPGQGLTFLIKLPAGSAGGPAVNDSAGTGRVNGGDSGENDSGH
jgi:signal transduction histidine kinase